MLQFSHCDDSDGAISAQLREKIIAFNQQHFEVKKRFPIAVCAHNDQSELIAGMSGNTFGNWLMIGYGLTVRYEVRKLEAVCLKK